MAYTMVVMTYLATTAPERRHDTMASRRALWRPQGETSKEERSMSSRQEQIGSKSGEEQRKRSRRKRKTNQEQKEDKSGVRERKTQEKQERKDKSGVQDFGRTQEYLAAMARWPRRGEPPRRPLRTARTRRRRRDNHGIHTSKAGARSGCSITASRKCKPPWWKGLFGTAPTDYQERERCEEREMASCLEAAKEACIKFSKEKCTAPFRNARIASEGLLENTDFIVWGAGYNKTSSTSMCVANNQYSLFNPAPGATNYKGSDLLDSFASKANSIQDDD